MISELCNIPYDLSITSFVKAATRNDFDIHWDNNSYRFVSLSALEALLSVRHLLSGRF